jgi:hypothetical protein
LKRPYAAAFLDGFTFLFYSFICTPSCLTKLVLKVASKIPVLGDIFFVTQRFFLKDRISDKKGSYQDNTRVWSLINRQCCISVDNHLPPEITESPITRHLLEWNALGTSEKSVFMSDNEGNNSIALVAVSMLRLCCPATTTLSSRTTLLASEMEELDSSFTRETNSGLTSWKFVTLDNPRRSLRELLRETRDQLSLVQSPLQQQMNGFDSWRHLLTSLNLVKSASCCVSATAQLVDDNIIQERRKLHKRMSRINKWQLLLLLHRIPWLRLLRQHALVQIPSQQNHLTWRLSTLHVSSHMLQTADTAMANEIRTQQYSTLQSYKSSSNNDALDRRVERLRTASEQHSRMLSYLQCERSYPLPIQEIQQQSTFGQRKCIDCSGVEDAMKRSLTASKIFFSSN